MIHFYFKKTKALSSLLMIFMLLFVLKANAQCPTGDVVLNTQAQVDQFIIDYPTCTTITGNLTVQGNNITNISGLSNIEHIGGFFRLWSNPSLTNIDGLSNLISVGNYFGIYNNPSLTNLNGLSSLENVIGYLNIDNNALLTNLNGLSNLNSLNDVLRIANNPALTQINALSSLTSIGGSLAIINNDALPNVNGLSSLTSVGGYIDIEENAVLSDISALQNTTFNPNGSSGLTIIDNPALAVCNLPNFCAYLANDPSTHPRSISGNLANCLDEAAVIAACTSPQCPTGDVNLTSQAEINQFAIDYPFCTEIAGNLQIGPPNGSVSDITSLSPLQNITSVQGNLFIQCNGVLQNVNGLNIQSVGGRVYIGGDNSTYTNLLLQNLDGLSSLTSIGGDLAIKNNTVLSSIGLGSLSSVGGGLYVANNNALTNVNGLSSLTNVGGYLNFIHNAALTNLNGLNSLTSVGEDIWISDNTILSDISALQNTTFNPNGSYGLTITDNPALAVCNLPNFCTYLANDPSTHPRNISGNLAECVNENAVLGACGLLGQEDVDAGSFSYYPNPVKDILNISAKNGIKTVEIYNTAGQEVKSQKATGNNAQFNMSGLQSGSYTVRVVTSKGVETFKVIKGK